MTIETINTTEMKPGDVITFYGNLYKITSGGEIAWRPGVYGFKAEWLAVDYPGAEPLTNWDYFQGNELAMWGRVTR